jgi:hypothetical protein
LNFWRTLVDSKTTKAEGRCVPLLQPSAHLRKLTGGGSSAENDRVKLSRRNSNNLQEQNQKSEVKKFFSVKANSVDGVWQALQSRGQGAVPNLPNLKRSRTYSRSRSNLGHSGFV